MLFSSNVTVACKMSKSYATTNKAIKGSSHIMALNKTDTLDLIMLTLMRQANDEEKCQNDTFLKDTWRRMTMSFNQQTNKNFTYTNLKN